MSLFRPLWEELGSSLASSAIFAYKLNWQTVLFVGLSESQIEDEFDTLQASHRQLFAKVSYAFQH